MSVARGPLLYDEMFLKKASGRHTVLLHAFYPSPYVLSTILVFKPPGRMYLTQFLIEYCQIFQN